MPQTVPIVFAEVDRYWNARFVTIPTDVSAVSVVYAVNALSASSASRRAPSPSVHRAVQEGQARGQGEAGGGLLQLGLRRRAKNLLIPSA